MKLGEGACLEKSVVQFGWYAGQAERATFLVGFQCRSGQRTFLLQPMEGRATEVKVVIPG